MKNGIRYEMIGSDPEKLVCKTKCPFIKKSKKIYVASAYCIIDCKNFYNLDEKSKILYCKGNKE